MHIFSPIKGFVGLAVLGALVACVPQEPVSTSADFKVERTNYTYSDAPRYSLSWFFNPTAQNQSSTQNNYLVALDSQKRVLSAKRDNVGNEYSYSNNGDYTVCRKTFDASNQPGFLSFFGLLPGIKDSCVERTYSSSDQLLMVSDVQLKREYNY